MRKFAPALCLIVSCASTPAAPPPSQSDPRLAELQTSLTELLERLDVLNDRIARLEERVSAAPQPQSVAPPTAAAAPVPRRVAEVGGATPKPSGALASAQIADNYRRGVMLYANGDRTGSRTIFQSVFDADPSGDLADNALFWIGETYFAAGDYPNAMRYYKRVTTEFGDQNKAPDALFKMALAYEKTGDLALARSTFGEVIRKYPYSPTAASAKNELKRIQY